MKKVILLIMAALLVVAFAVPAMADMPDHPVGSAAGDVELTRGMNGTFITGFAPAEGKASFGYWYIYMDVVADVDEYNTLLFEFGLWNASTAGTAGSVTVDSAYMDTDLGAYFGLPVGVVARLGNWWLHTRDFEATWSEVESSWQEQWYQINGVQGELDFGIGSLTVATSIGEDWAGDGGTHPVQAAILNMPELGPVDLQAFLYSVGQTDFKPLIGANVKVSFEPVDVAAGFAFDMAEGAHIAGDWGYGVGAAATLGAFRAGAALNGNSNDALNSINIEAGYELTEFLRADAGVGLSLAEGADTFQGAEVSVALMPGESEWRFGYIITQAAAYEYLSKFGQVDGGLFIQGSLGF
jgi:hypothetical protein